MSVAPLKDAYIDIAFYSDWLEAEADREVLESYGYSTLVRSAKGRRQALQVKRCDFLRANQELQSLTKLKTELHAEDEEQRRMSGEATRLPRVTGQVVFGMDIVWWLAGSLAVILGWQYIFLS